MEKCFSLILLFSHLVSSFADQSFYVLQVPNYVHFTETDSTLPVSEISDLISVSYGLPLYQELFFNGLLNGDLLRKPKANFLITLSGIGDQSAHLDLDSKFEFSIVNDQVFPETSSVISKLRRFVVNPLIVDFTEENTIFDLKAHNSDMFKSLSSSTDKVRNLIDSGNSLLKNYDITVFNTSQYSDLLFLSELQLINELIKALEDENDLVNDNMPDFYHFKLEGLKLLVETYGAESSKMHSAYGILQKFLKQISEQIDRLYNHNAIVEVLAISGENNDQGGRIRRSLLAVTDDTNAIISNLAPDVSADFSGNFNIVIWTSIILALVVTIIAYSMWNIDPGRNSILYRMTSQRIKKD